MLTSSVNTQTSIQNGHESSAVTTTSTYAYTWWNQAKQSTVTVTGSYPSNPNAYNWSSGNSTYTYDANGSLTQKAWISWISGTGYRFRGRFRGQVINCRNVPPC